MLRNMLSLLAVAAFGLMIAPLDPVHAQSDDARVRVVHASPDAPSVDVLVDGSAAFSGAAFKGISDYAALAAGTYGVQVVPAGETEPVVIEADLALDGGTDYTVVAVGRLQDIEPLVLVDNNSAPAAGKAHVRFVHASPDAPAVDIAVADGGPVLFSDIAFKGVGEYLPVDAGTYDLDVRVAGTEDVALAVPGVKLDAGTVYTIFAVGLAGGEPALTALPSVDAAHGAAGDMPETLPQTGAGDMLVTLLALAGLLMLGAGALVHRTVAVRA